MNDEISFRAFAQAANFAIGQRAYRVRRKLRGRAILSQCRNCGRTVSTAYLRRCGICPYCSEPAIVRESDVIKWEQSQGSGGAPRLAHTQEVAGSIPAPATNLNSAETEFIPSLWRWAS